MKTIIALVQLNEQVEVAKVFLQNIVKLITNYAPRVLLALFVLWVGIQLIRRISRLLDKIFKKGNLDVSLRPFLRSIIVLTLKTLLIISVASMLGIETTSFVAIVGAAGLAVGLALQGSLSNLAGGVLILLFRPFRVGDLIEAQGYKGHVQEISVLVTILTSPKNESIIMPNGPLINGNIVNYTTLGNIRADIPFGIAYDADIKLTRKVVQEVLDNHPQVIKEPSSGVKLSQMNASSLDFLALAYCKPNDYWNVFFDLNEQIKIALDENGIEIPFPQRVVHLKKES